MLNSSFFIEINEKINFAFAVCHFKIFRFNNPETILKATAMSVFSVHLRRRASVLWSFRIKGDLQSEFISRSRSGISNQLINESSFRSAKKVPLKSSRDKHFQVLAWRLRTKFRNSTNNKVRSWIRIPDVLLAQDWVRKDKSPTVFVCSDRFHIDQPIRFVWLKRVSKILVGANKVI